jgi:hypothetical protein
VTLNAAVSANFTGFGTPTGSVDFVDTTTNTDLGSVALSGGTASLTTAALTAGTQVITATYSGNSTFLGSSATLIQTVVPSILVLNPTASAALSLSGNSSINVPGNVVVDSNSRSALTESGNASIKATSIQVVGGDSQSGNATWSPTPVTGAASVPDPLATLAAPTGGTSQGSVNLSGNSTLTINPGIYTQISVSGKASLTLNPGVYIMAGGGLTVSGNASISGSGVMLYNTESAFPNPGGTYGGITLGGNGTFNLTAPSSGPYAGVVLFQARTNTRAISLSGNAAEGLGGTVYAPAALLYLSGNASLAGPMVVNELALTGNAASTQAVDASDVSSGATAGQLLAGNLEVYVDDPNRLFTAAELARIQDAVNAVDAVVEPFGVSVAETTDPSLANVVIDTGSSSAVGGYADGVLGCYTTAGEVTLIQGWDWYAGADPAQIGSGQYDFQTTLTHELGHALGLGESSNPASAMYGTLAPGTVIRALTTADLNIPYDEDGADADHAAVTPTPATDARPAAPPAVTGSAPVLAAVPANGAKVAVPDHPADVLTPAAVRLAEAAVLGGVQGGTDSGAPAAGAAAAGWPATLAAVGGNEQSPAAAVGVWATQPPPAGGGDADAPVAVPALADPWCPGPREPVTQEGAPRREPTDPAPSPEQRDARSPAALAASFRSGTGDSAGVGGTVGGNDAREVQVPAAGKSSLFALFGALWGNLWGARTDEPESRKQRRQRQR